MSRNLRLAVVGAHSHVQPIDPRDVRDAQGSIESRLGGLWFEPPLRPIDTTASDQGAPHSHRPSFQPHAWSLSPAA